MKLQRYRSGLGEQKLLIEQKHNELKIAKWRYYAEPDALGRTIIEDLLCIFDQPENRSEK